MGFELASSATGMPLKPMPRMDFFQHILTRTGQIVDAAADAGQRTRKLP